MAPSSNLFKASKYSEPLLALAFVSILVLSFLMFSPGLNGPFLFDDFPNLETLGFFGGVSDVPSALYFIFGNESGPLGRPLSMATFLLNDSTWPSIPYSFKYTNLLFHLINGCLVFKLLLQFGRILGGNVINLHWLGLIVMLVWLIHPFNISSVLYVIQRMTILSSTMILLGLITYLHFRVVKDISRIKLIVAVGMVAFLCAVGLLFKETAISLVFYIAAIEFTIFELNSNKNWKLFRRMLLVSCLSLICVIFTKAMFFSEAAWQNRDFDILERLITQSRVMWDYFLHILIPRAGGTGLLHDDIQISRSLLDPIIGVIAVIGLLGVVVFGIFARKKLPIISLCIFWFIGGHILESTALPLENYFEHRNYLPMLLLIWGCSYGIYKLVFANLYKYAFCVCYISLSMIVFSSTVHIWGEESLLVRVWGEEHPNSPRARQMYARQLMTDGNPAESLSQIQESLRQNPNNHHLMMQEILLKCLLDDEFEITDYQDRFLGGPKNNGVLDGLKKLRTVVVSDGCKFLTIQDLLKNNKYFIENENYQDPSTSAYLYNEQATLYVILGDLGAAIESLDSAYSADNTNIIFPLNQAYWLSDAGLYDEAKKYLEIASRTTSDRYFQKAQYDKLYKKAQSDIEFNLKLFKSEGNL